MKTAVPENGISSTDSEPELEVIVPSCTYKRQLNDDNCIPGHSATIRLPTPPLTKKRKVNTFTEDSYRKLVEKNAALKRRVETHSLLLTRKGVEISKLKKKLGKNKKSQKIERELQQKPPRTKWTTNQLNLALSWHYKCPSLYNHMRNKSKLTLPSPRTRMVNSGKIGYWLRYSSFREA